MKTASVSEVFWAFFKLGLTSFGGPVAHLAYFRHELVQRRRWLTEQAYAELIAVCQFLPGPASSQVGFAMGLMRAGWAGALAAWLAFTLPSAVIMMVVAWLVTNPTEWATALGVPAVIHGLKWVAVVVVTQAVVGMARSLCIDRPTVLMALVALLSLLLLPSVLPLPTVVVMIGVMVLGAAVGVRWCQSAVPSEIAGFSSPVSRTAAKVAGGLLVMVLLALPGLGFLFPETVWSLVDSMARAGALVLGGGHVVLPLLEAELVSSKGLSHEDFIAGYGAAQALPGPLFAVAAYFGAVLTPASPVLGAALALMAIFLPGLLLLVWVLPYWQQLRSHRHASAAMAGASATVVGLLAAALIHPIGTSAMTSLPDVLMVSGGLLLLMLWRWPILGVIAAMVTAALVLNVWGLV